MTGEFFGPPTEVEVAIARALCEHDIRVRRRWDTSLAKLERMLPPAVDRHWPEYLDQARAAIKGFEQLVGRFLEDRR